MPRELEPEVMDDRLEAEAYATADFADVNQAFVERLLDLAGPREEMLGVDLGAGPADIPIRLIRERPHWRIVAVDASEAMLVHAERAVKQARMSDAIELLLADAKATPLPSSSFDMVFSNSILHHIAEPEAFWVEVRRVALPGALVVVRDLARPATPAEAQALVAQYAGDESALLQEEFYRSFLSSCTPEEVRAQLDAVGLECLHVAMVSDRHLDVFGRLP